MKITLDEDTVKDLLRVKQERDNLRASECDDIMQYLNRHSCLDQRAIRMFEIIATAASLQKDFGRVA